MVPLNETAWGFINPVLKLRLLCYPEVKKWKWWCKQAQLGVYVEWASWYTYIYILYIYYIYKYIHIYMCVHTRVRIYMAFKPLQRISSAATQRGL